ncbi:MAG: lipoate protein ligase C-terminal domain-containing protein [Bacilli bacterium]
MISYDLKSLGTNKISFYLALEQVLLSNLEDDVFFLWDISTSIVAGRHQLIPAEINQNYVNSHHIPVFRRPSGGGTIYADRGCFMYSFLTKERNREVIYQKYLTKFMNCLREIGLDVVLSGRNDLLFQGKKFSGTAIYQTNEGSILHGTFLYNTNLHHLVKVLTVDKTKMTSKGIRSVKERVINLKPYVGMSKNDLMDNLLHRMADEVNYPVENWLEKITFYEDKFTSKEWIDGQNPKYSVQFKKRFSFGSIEAYVLLKGNQIQKLDFRGDFFVRQPLDFFYSQFHNQPFTLQGLMAVLLDHSVSDYIFDATNDDLISLFFQEEL